MNNPSLFGPFLYMLRILKDKLKARAFSLTKILLCATNDKSSMKI